MHCPFQPSGYVGIELYGGLLKSSRLAKTGTLILTDKILDSFLEALIEAKRPSHDALSRNELLQFKFRK
tara:strand:+ start:294 stop:500 length:207 start_codon:yes stop_codon:yes gene_type:complete